MLRNLSSILLAVTIMLILAGCGRLVENRSNPPDPALYCTVKIPDIPTPEATPIESIFDFEAFPYVQSDQSAIIVYKTDPTIKNSQLFYGKDPAKLDRVAAHLESSSRNSTLLLGLNPGEEYFYKIQARDDQDLVKVSEIKNFRLPSQNLARGKTVTGTFNYLPPHDSLVNQTKAVLSRVVDGLTGYFEGMATSGPIIGEDQQVTIDLGAIHPVNSIVSYWRALAYPESYCVKVSEDNINFREIASKINAAQGAFSRSDAGDPLRVISLNTGGTLARYIQIFIARNSPYYVKHPEWDFVQLMEVQVFP